VSIFVRLRHIKRQKFYSAIRIIVDVLLGYGGMV